ncbi:hypothetical protein BDR04DRAFT_1091021 [Suillus decipiens]|nr:hypothetical protein BDR04DRAFT_1091021 [Suillus decipiens]
MLLTGSFSTKNKDDLIDIAGALQIFTACLMTLFRMSPLPHTLILILVIPILHCMQDHLPAILSQAFLPLTLLPTILMHLIHT